MQQIPEDADMHLIAMQQLALQTPLPSDELDLDLDKMDLDDKGEADSDGSSSDVGVEACHGPGASATPDNSLDAQTSLSSSMGPARKRMRFAHHVNAEEEEPEEGTYQHCCGCEEPFEHSDDWDHFLYLGPAQLTSSAIKSEWARTGTGIYIHWDFVFVGVYGHYAPTCFQCMQDARNRILNANTCSTDGQVILANHLANAIYGQVKELKKKYREYRDDEGQA
jgi:hypothetical protein